MLLLVAIIRDDVRGIGGNRIGRFKFLLLLLGFFKVHILYVSMQSSAFTSCTVFKANERHCSAVFLFFLSIFCCHIYYVWHYRFSVQFFGCWTKKLDVIGKYNLGLIFGLKWAVFVLLGQKFVGFMQVQFLTHQL